MIPDQNQPSQINAPTTPQVVTPPVVTPEAGTPNTPQTPSVATPMPAPVTPSNAAPKKLNIPKFDPQEMMAMIKKMPLKFKILAGFVTLLIVLLILASFTKKGKAVVQQLVLPSASPIPATTPVGEVLVPTQYANDQEIVTIEQSLKDFDSKLARTNLTEDGLRVPNLDYSISFKK